MKGRERSQETGDGGREGQEKKREARLQKDKKNNADFFDRKISGISMIVSFSLLSPPVLSSPPGEEWENSFLRIPGRL